MAKSSEYPDLQFVRPRSYTTSNRASVQLIVIHTTEGSAHSASAEDGAAYDARRPDGTSTHYFHDNSSTVQCVLTKDIAHTARSQGNRRGVQHELCTRAGTAKWSDAYHQAMLKRAAKQAARDARKWQIPVRHLTVAEVAAGKKGFCGHYDITRAFPQDNGSHTDPGSNFPWSQFLDMVRAELAPAPAPPKQEDDDVTEAQFMEWMTKWARSGAGRQALSLAVLGTEPPAPTGGAAYPAGTVRNPDPATRTANPTFAASHPLERVLAIESKVDRLLEQ